MDGGRHAVKRVTGETLRVEADLAIDGHDLLAARLHVRAAGDARWIELPMQPVGPERRDTWVGEVVPQGHDGPWWLAGATLHVDDAAGYGGATYGDAWPQPED